MSDNFSNSLYFDMYYNPTATEWVYLPFTSKYFTASPSHCIINSVELRDTGCAGLSTPPSSVSTYSYFKLETGSTPSSAISFKMNTAYASFGTMPFTKQVCLWAENGHFVTRSQEFQFRLNCPSNQTVTAGIEVRTAID